ncbi:hypothetical protein Ssi02_21770 [Sinosporangium siamense]|uniref:FtsX-like permease family protein n=2 Tax=Sinosporangium siamense TaxID=1367973 RepID=A0A919RH98_9ACTN|nr:hypothetical protein Ssi02_21770 [Sinosporangium siamense]
MLIVILGAPGAFVVFAARSAPDDRHGPVLWHYLVLGTLLTVIGLVVMGLTAWYTHEDVHYDDFGSAMTFLAAMLGGTLFLLGLGPFIPWLLGVLGRHAVRLPPPIRLAVRDVAGNRTRTAPAIATALISTALAIALMIISFATTAQKRVKYHPEARSGALLVREFSTNEAAAVHAAIRHELPGVPIVQSYREHGPAEIELEIPNVELPFRDGMAPDTYVGDQALLRYLTGDPATPYDENTAVVVTTDESKVVTATLLIQHDSVGGRRPVSKTIPAIGVSPTEPDVQGLFIPAKVMRDLGYQLEQTALIVDPSSHRTSAAEQERIGRRLGDAAVTYVERGFQAPAGWIVFATVLIAIAFYGALIAPGRTAATSRSRRVLLRTGASTAALRLFSACRTGFSAACGTALGAVAGCSIGLLLAWPATTSSGWEDSTPRVAFDTPWLTISALVAGLPILTAAIAALAPTGTTTRSGATEKTSH